MQASASRDKPARVPFRLVLGSIIVIWMAYFILTTIRAAVADFSMQEEMLWRRAVVTIVGMCMTLLVWLILCLFDQKPQWVKVMASLIVALPAAIPIAQTNQWIFADIQQEEGERILRERGGNVRRDEAGNLMVDIPVETPDGQAVSNGEPPPESVSESLIVIPAATALDRWRQIVGIAFDRYFILLAWSAFYFAMLAGEQSRAAERRGERFRSAAKAAELRSLRYQVNPHFLFNALNSLSALVMTGKSGRAETMIQALSSFYRHSLADERTSDNALEEEIALQQHYLEIEAVRFPDRLRVEIDLPDRLRRARVPGMILQPLIENSVKYAVAPLKRVVTIRIAAREEDQQLILTVSDDGPGAQNQVSNGFGIGLTNVYDRLEARFGPKAQMHSAPADQGYITEIRMPLRFDAGDLKPPGVDD